MLAQLAQNPEPQVEGAEDLPTGAARRVHILDTIRNTTLPRRVRFTAGTQTLELAVANRRVLSVRIPDLPDLTPEMRTLLEDRAGWASPSPALKDAFLAAIDAMANAPGMLTTDIQRIDANEKTAKGLALFEEDAAGPDPTAEAPVPEPPVRRELEEAYFAATQSLGTKCLRIAKDGTVVARKGGGPPPQPEDCTGLVDALDGMLTPVFAPDGTPVLMIMRSTAGPGYAVLQTEHEVITTQLRDSEIGRLLGAWSRLYDAGDAA